MSYWEGIVGCGLKDYPVISLMDLLEIPPDMEQVISAIVTSLGEVFGFEMVESKVEQIEK